MESANKEAKIGEITKVPVVSQSRGVLLLVFSTLFYAAHWTGLQHSGHFDLVGFELLLEEKS